MENDPSDGLIAKRWRQRAGELRAMAERASDQLGKRSLLMLAGGYEAMAAWREGKANRDSDRRKG